LAKFNVIEKERDYHIDFISSDNTKISIDASETDTFDKSSIFESLENVSGFFEKGAIGYSPNGRMYDGLELVTHNWKVRPLKVHNVESSFFMNESIFPEGSIKFDNALLMTSIKHEWHNIAIRNAK
jgi:hypothetical protein